MPRAEVGDTSLTWRTALRCNGGACVRVAVSGQAILVGDSKNPDGPILMYSAAGWRRFVLAAKNGNFDDLASA